MSAEPGSKIALSGPRHCKMECHSIRSISHQQLRQQVTTAAEAVVFRGKLFLLSIIFLIIMF